MSILANRIYYIDSEERLTGSSSNFTASIVIPDGSQFDSCCVLALTIPRSYYLIRDGQNQMTLVIDSVPYLLTVPKGNYTAMNFNAVLTQLMNGVSSNVFTMTFNGITGKYTYKYTGSAITVAIVLADPSRLGHQLGFEEIGTNVFVAKTLGSTNVVDFVSTSTLFLHSDCVDDSSSILQEVYSDNSVPFSNLVYNCKFPSMYTKQLRSASNGVYSFSLCDEHDKEVDLNGHQILFTLLLYRKENLTRLAKSFIASFSHS